MIQRFNDDLSEVAGRMIIEVLKGNSTVTSVDVVSWGDMILHVLHLLH